MRYSPAGRDPVRDGLHANGSSGPAESRRRWRRGTRHARHLACPGCRRLALPHRERRRGGARAGRRCRRAPRGTAGRAPQPGAGARRDPALLTPDRRGRRRSRPCPLALAGLARVLRGETDGAAVRHDLPRQLFHRLAGQAAIQRDHDAGCARHRDLGIHRTAHRRDLRRQARQDQDHPARRGPLCLRPGARRPGEDRRAPRRLARAGRAADRHAAGAVDRMEGASCAARSTSAGRGGRLLPLRRHRRCEARRLPRPRREADRGAGDDPHRPAHGRMRGHAGGLSAGRRRGLALAPPRRHSAVCPPRQRPWGAG